MAFQLSVNDFYHPIWDHKKKKKKEKKKEEKTLTQSISQCKDDVAIADASQPLQAC